MASVPVGVPLAQDTQDGNTKEVMVLPLVQAAAAAITVAGELDTLIRF